MNLNDKEGKRVPQRIQSYVNQAQQALQQIQQIAKVLKQQEQQNANQAFSSNQFTAQQTQAFGQKEQNAVQNLQQIENLAQSLHSQAQQLQNYQPKNQYQAVYQAQQPQNQYQSQSSGFSINPLSGQASQTNVNEVRQQNQQSAQQIPN